MEALLGSVRTFLTVSSSSETLGSQSLSAVVSVLAGDEGGGEVELRLPKFTPFFGNLRVPVDWVTGALVAGGGVTFAYLRRCGGTGGRSRRTGRCLCSGTRSLETDAEAAFLALSRCEMWILPLILGVYQVAHRP